ncbi:hypothetical protein BDW68DRAFT_170939 [Aspergillus falconensis]
MGPRPLQHLTHHAITSAASRQALSTCHTVHRSIQSNIAHPHPLPHDAGLNTILGFWKVSCSQLTSMSPF